MVLFIDPFWTLNHDSSGITNGHTHAHVCTHTQTHAPDITAPRIYKGTCTVEAEMIGSPPDVLVFEQNSHTLEGFLMK